MIKNPIDLSLVRKRLSPPGRYYVSLDMFLADIRRICENCRLYNADTTTYWECASRLEAYAMQRVSEVRVTRLDP